MHLADLLGFAAAGQPQLGAALAALPHLPPCASHCLLSGPERSGKTSLLFHAALSLARQGREVLVLCRRCALASHLRHAACAEDARHWCCRRPASLPAPLLPRRSLCCRPKLEAAPPLLPEGLSRQDPAWQLVHLKYLANGGWAGRGRRSEQGQQQRQLCRQDGARKHGCRVAASGATM